MDTLDFEKKVHSLNSLDKDTICTVLVLIPNGVDDSTNDKLQKAFNKCVEFIGLSHVDSDGFHTDKANAIFVDNRIGLDYLKNISNFCEELGVIPLSFYMKYEDLDNLDGSFIGKVLPIK